MDAWICKGELEAGKMTFLAPTKKPLILLAPFVSAGNAVKVKKTD